jgi:hypothetical protein
VLALGVDSLNLPHGEGLKALTFGVVLATNFVQGLSMGEVVQRLRLTLPRRIISSEPIVTDDSSV